MNAYYLTSRFYAYMTVFVILFVASAIWPILYYPVAMLLCIFVCITFYDVLIVKKLSQEIFGNRSVVEKLSLGDHQYITYSIQNTGAKNKVNIDIYDELPTQFQFRSEIASITLNPNEKRTILQDITPLSRGEYIFGNLYCLLSLPSLNLVKYKRMLDGTAVIQVYPSILQMKKYAIQIFSRTASFYGIRRVRTIGENDEFEHIRNYVIGDNIRSINWQATSRKGELLVNQFQDSRSQMVYSIIDKGRSMEMPFNGLSLLDYAINSCLVISNIVLQKYDKAGLITFEHKIDNMLKAEANLNQLDAISQLLYNQQSSFKESNFELLYFSIRKYISKRSILILFSNFEDKYDLERNLDYLRMINMHHLLIVVSFINSELEAAAEIQPNNQEEIYRKTINQSALIEKEIIMKEIKNAGIQFILTKPEDLSINVINKYLEIKAKRMK